MINKIIDVGIITFIPIELKALFNIFKLKEDNIVISNSRFSYWKTELYSEVNKRNLTVVFSHINGESNNTEASICTSHFLRDWYPKLMCLIGIGAGIKNKIKIGDVIIPKTIHDRTVKVYKEGKYITRGVSYSRIDSIEKIFKKNSVTSKEFNLNINKNLKSEIVNVKRVVTKKKMTNKEFQLPLTILDGSISSDNVLIRDSEYFKSIVNEIDEKCRGGEMESSGFIRSCQVENVGFPWIVFRGISDFGDKKKDDSFQDLAAKSASIAAKLYLSKIINYDLLSTNNRSIEEKTSLEYNLISQIDEAYKLKRWNQVCQIGKILSRHLLISGQNELRLKIGKMVEEAAGIINELDVRSNTLIDDLGWTSFILKKPEAKKYIFDGLRLANEIPDSYYIKVKAYRHLASISRQERKYKEAHNYLSKAELELNNINNIDDFNELKSSLVLSEGKLSFSQREYKESINYFKIALKLFKKNKDGIRESKVYSLIGNSYLKNGDKEKALNLFKKGKEVASKFGRYDEFVKNSESLIRLVKDNKDKFNLAKAVYEFSLLKGLLKESNYWKEIMLKFKI